MGEKKYDAMMENGRRHLEFAAQLYEAQSKAGRYYLHEHPASASSWKEPAIQNLINNHGGILTTAHLCQYGMKSTDQLGEDLVKKPTKFLTNSICISKWLDRKCSGGHRHVQLIGGRAGPCEVYPTPLCEAIVRGLKDQMEADGISMVNSSLLAMHHEEEHKWDE